MKRTLMSVAMSIALASPSAAATLVAGPLNGGDSSIVGCAITSLKKSGDLIGSVTLIDQAGNVVDGNGLVIPPGFTQTVSGNVDDQYHHCVFEFQGGKKQVRATACVLDEDNRCITSVAAE